MTMLISDLILIEEKKYENGSLVEKQIFDKNRNLIVLEKWQNGSQIEKI